MEKTMNNRLIFLIIVLICFGVAWQSGWLHIPA